MKKIIFFLFIALFISGCEEQPSRNDILEKTVIEVFDSRLSKMEKKLDELYQATTSVDKALWKLAQVEKLEQLGTQAMLKELKRLCDIIAGALALQKYKGDKNNE